MNYLKLFFLLFLISIPLDIVSSPWIPSDNIKYNLIKFNLTKLCSYNLQENHISQIPIINIINQINNIDSDNIECNSYIDEVRTFLRNFSIDKTTVIGFQSDSDDLFMNDRSHRYSSNGNFFVEIKDLNNRLSYNLKVSKYKNQTIFDDSYIAFKRKNTVIQFGKVTRWWSPSENSSLIMSNSASPPLTFSIKNYGHSQIKNFNFISNINYEVFISKLERGREIPNTRLFGNKFNFTLFDKVEMSLMRVAQFGGKGRPMNSDNILRMISGKDNTNRNLSRIDQSGNQIAGIDFSTNIFKNNNGRMYFQLIGEDGLDPIIDDRWIGAIFPSKRFSLGGLSYNFLSTKNPTTLIFEHINTDTGFKNVTYNHSLYKTGYRYKGFPIGETTDTDSHRSLIALKKYYNDSYLKISFQKMNINQNLSERTRWGNNNIKNNEITIRYTKNFKEKYCLSMVFVKRNTNDQIYSNHLFFINFEKRI